MGAHVNAGDLKIWTEQVGQGPDVLLIGGAGDTVESWQFQLDGLADRYRLTAFDNRGAGRTAMPPGPVSAEMMADDAAAVLQALEVPSAHVAGFSGASIVAQELALRHPELVRSLVLQSTWPVPDAYLRAWLLFVRWLVEVAPSEQAFLEGFFLDIYTARAHNDGTVAQFIQEVLVFPHKQATQDLQRYLDAFLDHDTTNRLPEDHRPDPRAGRRPRLDRTPAGRPRRRRPHPQRPVPGHAGGGSSALPGGPRGVERPRRRLLAPDRDAGLSPPGSIANGATGHTGPAGGEAPFLQWTCPPDGDGRSGGGRPQRRPSGLGCRRTAAQ
jgi:3-oxoadipate enol-lactonase